MRLVLAAAILAAASPAAADAPPDLATALTDPTRLPLRTHIARAGTFGLTVDTTVDDADPGEHGSYDDVPVVETAPGRVRIVHDEDAARMFLWIDEKDLAWGIATKTRIAGKGDVGVWLLPGARVTATGSGPRRKVVATFNAGLDVSLRGVVPAVALARTFALAPEPTSTGGDGQTWHAPQLRLEPGGRRIAGLPGGLNVQVVAPGRGGWKLVEHRSRWLEVRGWIHERDLSSEVRSMDSGHGGGYGRTHTDRVEVAKGTCLHASPGGPIVGIQTATKLRYTTEHDTAWWTVLVGNAWGVFPVHVKKAGADGGGKPTFAPCPP